MTELRDRVQNALDEARILVLGIQVLLGMQFRSFFEPRFQELPAWARRCALLSLALLLLSFMMVVFPTIFHRTVERGEDTDRLDRVTTRWMAPTLLPLTFALSLSLVVSSVERLGSVGALALASGTGLLALGLFYLFPWLRRSPAPVRSGGDPPTSVEHKIRHVLTETRVVLPGALALLGFQLTTPLMEGFGRLSGVLQTIHLIGTALIALTVVLLLTPAAFHRIAEHGEATERFHRLASRMICLALPFLVAGMGAELWVVVERTTGSRAYGIAAACSAFFLAMSLWFGTALFSKRRVAESRSG